MSAPLVASVDEAGFAALRRAWPLAAVFASGALTVGALGAAHGGYYPTSWGWVALLCSAAVTWIVCAGRAARPTTLAMTAVSCLAFLCGWSALSTLWGEASATSNASARLGVYVVVLGTAVLVCRKAFAPTLLGGVLCGADGLAIYALTTRLFPASLTTFDSIAGYRLAAPLGYWNALGLLSALAVLLAIRLVVTSNSPALCAAVAAASVPVVAALYFTFSRGAWLSLGIGLVCAMLLERERVAVGAATIAIGAPASAAVILSAYARGLTHQGVSAAVAAHDGHRLAVWLGLLSIAAAVLSYIVVTFRQKSVVPASVSRAYTVSLLILVVAAGCTALVRVGGPVHASERLWSSFSSSPPSGQTDLRARLFSFSGTGRVDLWRAAISDFEQHPLAGSGAGSYEAYWLRHRPRPLKVRNAHSLYLETLAELGVVGLLLLVIALAMPLVAAVRARSTPGVGVAAGAYASFLVGAGVDWDWQIVSLTVATLLIGASLLASDRSVPDESSVPSLRFRRGAVGVALGVSVLAFVFLVGNMFLSRSASAARSDNQVVAAMDAGRATHWLPWSTQPWEQLGEAQLAQGRTSAAQTSFRTAIKKDSGDWNLWLDLARASTGKVQQQAIRRATSLNPLSPEIKEFKSELGSTGGISLGVSP